MPELKDLLQSADWKAEKHVPVIELPDTPKKGEFFKLSAVVGKEIAHPNKTEHHISWIELYFQPQGERFPYLLARSEFCAHGASVNGPDTSSVYSHPEVAISIKTDKSGVLYALSYCNIHGLWQSSRELKIV